MSEAEALLKLVGSPGPVLQALGLGAIRPPDPRQHGADAGRRCRHRARRGRAEGPGAHHRRDAALLRGRSRSRAASRRWRKPGATSRPSAACRSPSPTTSISAAPSGPEVMGQFVGCLQGIGEACRALDFPVVSGNVSLYNETNGQGILPTPAIGGVGLLDDVTVNASVAFKREGEAIILIGETRGLARPVDLPARHLRPRGRRAAAGRSRPGEAQRRFRAPAHPLRPGRRPSMTARTAALRWRSPRWRWRAASARRSRPSPRTCRATPSCSARIRPATCSRSDRTRPPTSSTRPAAIGIPAAMLGVTGGDALILPGRAGHIGRSTEGRARSLAAGLHGRQVPEA